MGHLRLGLVLAALGMMAAACGDDDDDAGKADAGPSTAGGNGGSGGIMVRDPVGGKGGAGGSSGAAGTLTEGAQCGFNVGCAAGLTCTDSGVGTEESGSVKICARPCTTNTIAADCMQGEQCYADNTGQGYCIDLVREGFAPCGPLSTSQCDEPFQCQYLVDDDMMTQELEFEGRCLQSCEPEADADAGFSMSDCADGQTCLPLATMGGICVVVVDLNESCADFQTVCDGQGETSLCVPDDLNAPDPAQFSCRQLCTDAPDSCTTGACTTVRDNAGNMAELCL